MHTESGASPTQVTLLIGAFLLLSVPAMFLPELSHEEALYATIAQEMQQNNDFVTPHFQGSAILVEPMCAWVLSLIDMAVGLNEITIRLVGILPTLLLALICMFTVRRVAPGCGALATGAAVCSSLAAIRIGVVAENDMLFALFINAAWISFYLLSRERKRWMYAWSTAHLLLVCALFTGGIQALFFFYFPLLLMRQPLKVIRRLWKPEHLFPLAVLVVGMICWPQLVQWGEEEVVRVFQEFTPAEHAVGYLRRVIEFPLRAVIGFVPWAFLAWPGFCAAFHPLEKNPVLCQYLRTIIYSLFYFFWIIPASDAKVLLPLIGPVAILLGMNYELLIRRYSRQLRMLPLALSGIAVAGIIATAVTGVLKVSTWQVPTPMILVTGGCMLAAAGIVTAVWLNRRKAPVWLLVAGSVMAVQLTAVGSFQVYNRHKKSHSRNFAENFSKYLLPGVTVYELIPGHDIYPSECYYLERLGDPRFTELGERLEKLKQRPEQGLIGSVDFLKELLELTREVERLGDPRFTELGERLEKLKKRHEQGLIGSVDFRKELLELAREVVVAGLHPRVVRINDIAEIKKKNPYLAKKVYVIGRHRMPVSRFYEWHELSDITEYKKIKLRLWEGVRR
jgi:4-amino-4-deoxy-L-arabinose transferase-like glycosyltransferase